MKPIQMTRQGGPEALDIIELPDPQPGPSELELTP
jgi:NADPH:quinone reductase-like Zn-dependent oxidoreductase